MLREVKLAKSPEKMVEGIADLASFPVVALEIDAALADENTGVEEIGAIIQKDPAMSLNMLRIANSAFYHRGKDVESVSQAVSIIGSRRARDIVFTQCATDAFKTFPNDLLTETDFWNTAPTARSPRKSLVIRSGLLAPIRFIRPAFSMISASWSCLRNARMSRDAHLSYRSSKPMACVRT